MDLFEKIRELIAEIAEVDVADIRGDTHFVNELGVDSLAALEVLAVLEKRYRIQIPEEFLPRMTTLDNIVALVEARLAA